MSVITLAEGWDPKAQAVPGHTWDRDSKSYVVREEDLTPRTAMVVLTLFPHLVLEHPVLADIRDRMAQDVRPVDNATPYNRPVAAPGLEAEMDLLGMDFYGYQSLDLGYLSDVIETHGAGYMGWERGLGKTLGTLAIIDEKGLEQNLIVCPNTAKAPVWEAECRKWMREWSTLVLPNEKVKRERTMELVQQLRSDGHPFILIVHYEALAIIARHRNKSGNGWKKYGEWDLIAGDEIHRIKNPKSQMTRALKKIPAKRKLALSGSVIENHAEELYSTLNWMFPDRYSSKWRDWNDRFLDYVEGGYGKIFVGIKTEKLDEMRDELGVFMVYRRKEDELDLPDKTGETITLDISKAQRRAYDELVTQCITTLDDDTTVAAIDGLPMLVKLRQIATGLDLVGGVSDSTKMAYATDLIKDNEDEAFVVFSWFKGACHAMKDRLEGEGIEAFIIDGDVRQAHRNEIIESFQAGEGRVLIGTLSTMSESVNLFRANNAIFLDRSWNPATNVQAEDRIYRIGQDKPVTITHLVARDTVDEYRLGPTIANKEALRRLILGG